jgi:molecular chaperone GrpE
MGNIKANSELEAAMAEALDAVENPSAGEDQETVVELEVDEDGEPIASPGGGISEETHAELKNQFMRLAADFDNFRKRARKEQQEARKSAIEAIGTEMLLVVDNLERALEHTWSQQDNPIVQGVEMVHKQFLDVLKNHGIESFESVGMAFDPEYHEAVGQVPSEDAPVGSIVEEVQRGYKIAEKLLRAARVMVATPAKKEAPDNGAGEEQA